MSALAPARAVGRPAASAVDVALDRATGARLVSGNALRHYADSSAALDALCAIVDGARRSISFENYIVHADRTGRRVAAALASRARAGVQVRVLYDAFGCRWTPRWFWRELRRAGVQVRAVNPILTSGPFEFLQRDHRKLVVADGLEGILGGVCIGDEWAGDAARGVRPWRDTMVSVRGPAAMALDRAFARLWGRDGDSFESPEGTSDDAAAGDVALRVIEGLPGESRTYRTVQVLALGAVERIWITDAYFVAPAPLYAALADAARGGVDVRLLLPGWSDAAVVRTFTRVGYRDLLTAGVRIYEWLGPMLHAKTTLVDRRWSRVGSSNLNMSSLLANYELDVLVESTALADELAAQFRRDVAQSREIVLRPRQRRRPALVGAPAPEPVVPHRKTRRERTVAAVVALRQVAGGLRRALNVTATLGLAVLGALLLAFPQVMGMVLAAGAFWMAAGIAWYGVLRRRRQAERDDL